MIDPVQLQTLAAILRLGSFEAAATSAGVTPSAVSQRIRALEEKMGAPLVRRGIPCQATPLGARLARHAEDLQLLERALAEDVAEFASETAPVLRIAVNADSLATWFLPALLSMPAARFDLVVDDQDHSTDWLRRGEVQAAVTGHADPVPGCDVYPLGLQRFVATANPAFVKRWFDGGPPAYGSLSAAPALTFNQKDRLQSIWAEGVAGRPVMLPTHYLPSSRGFVDAAVLGLGWAVMPQSLVRDQILAGKLVEILPGRPLDVPLYWQVGRIMARALKPLTQAVRKVAAADLLPLK
jgi:LysR family transcriptional regulator (chromosome initiation inhibitor)